MQTQILSLVLTLILAAWNIADVVQSHIGVIGWTFAGVLTLIIIAEAIDILQARRKPAPGQQADSQ